LITLESGNIRTIDRVVWVHVGVDIPADHGVDAEESPEDGHRLACLHLDRVGHPGLLVELVLLFRVVRVVPG